MPVKVDADYLVVGAGAAGMAFVDSLVTHADVRVALVDRRHGPGGHWLDAYPFVRLHQASAFYGVASTELGDGRIQTRGPEAGLHERASAPQVCAYYDRLLTHRLLPTDKVELHAACDYLGEGRFVSLLSGQQYDVGPECRVVDARYLAPLIPATTPPPFAVADGSRVVAVNDLASLDSAPQDYVVVGSGKTATDACIWLMRNGVDPDRICWVRPRDPWMLNRAVVQPDPVVFLGMAADTFVAAAEATSPDDLFLRLESAGIMLRIDTSTTPTMAKTPTLAQWELDLLRSIERVVRSGHLRAVEPGRLTLSTGEARVSRNAVVVHCAAPGLRYPPLVPIWAHEAITLQPVRAGFPCFGAALIGYVEATRDDDTDKNRICPPSPYPDTPRDWALMQVLGTRAAAAFGREPDVREWADTVLLNPARRPPERAGDPALREVTERLARAVEPGLAQLEVLAAMGRDSAARTRSDGSPS